MKPIIIEVDWFFDILIYLAPTNWYNLITNQPLSRYVGITLFNIILLDKSYYEKFPHLKQRTIRHEYIHYEQYKELYIVGFLYIYLFDFLAGLIKYNNGSVAYRRIRLEQEAHANEKDVNYLLKRKKFAWKKYKV